jgi:sodium transport system permease protein
VLAIVWLLVALIPTSALFSACCLALAAFARSTKEGQYYLMPLLLVTMPLMILPMAPGVEMTLGNSFIPVTGVVLLLRMLLEGNYVGAAPYIVPVAVVTGACCLLAMRWAIEQFNTESVLFRESERLDVGLWLRHLMTDRGDTPSTAEAVFCGLLILIIMFFMSFALPPPRNFGDFINVIAVTQLAVIATPALLMTVMLTRSPRKTLLLRIPPLLSVPAAVLLAVVLHPALKFLQMRVQELYPVNQDLFAGMAELLQGAELWQLVLVIGVLPAICEELAFRGFILSGLRKPGHKWRAIIVSSLFFGFTHSMFQQSLIASLVGTVIAYIAVQTGSILPGILYHATHNSLLLLASHAVERGEGESLYYRVGQDFGYHWWVVLAGLAVGCGLLCYFWRLDKQAKPQRITMDPHEGVKEHRLAG